MPMSERSSNQEIWATLEDTYDHDTANFGPFPDLTAAHRFCDAKNRQIVENVRKEIGHQELLALLADGNKAFGIEPDSNNPKEVIGLKLQYRLGCWMHCLDYDHKQAIVNFIKTPQPDNIDAEAEARTLGCTWEYECRLPQQRTKAECEDEANNCTGESAHMLSFVVARK